jgi:hypothetical protein
MAPSVATVASPAALAESVQFRLTDDMRRQGHVEYQVLNEFNRGLEGLSCAVDPDLVLRMHRPDWHRWDRVRVLWVSVCEDPGATRVAVGLVPEDLAVLHDRPHRNSKETFGWGWARRPLVVASLRATISALLDVNLPDGNPFATHNMTVSQWARALALHFLGLRELTRAAVARYLVRDDCSPARAGTHTAGLEQDVGPLLKSINYLYTGNGITTDDQKRPPNFLSLCAIAISFACGAIEGRSEASSRQIQRLQRQLPPEFRVEMVSSLPRIAVGELVVPPI